MAQVLLYRFNIVPSTETVDGISMAKIMKPKVGLAQLFHDTLEILVENFIVDVPPELCGEYQIVRIGPSITQGGCPGFLSLLLQL